MTTMLSTIQLVAPAELCAATARLWRDRLGKEIRDTHEEACIDMSKTRFIDSSGLGVLIGVNKAMRSRGGVLKILNPTAAVMQLIELTRLHRVLDIIRA